MNTASNYYGLLRKCISEAYHDHHLPFDLAADMDKIKTKKTKREYLTLDEVRKLRDTPCEHDVLKRASMFSILTGLRISDILSLRWENIAVAPDGGPCIRKLMIKQDSKIVCNYDRGWDIEPKKGSDAEKAMQQVLEMYKG